MTNDRPQIQDPLLITIEDQELSRVLDARITDIKRRYNDDDIDSRRATNLRYLLGDDDPDLPEQKDHRARYKDNLIYEAERSIKPIALSRLPDIVIRPGRDSEASKELAKDVTEIIDTDLKKREIRRVLGVAHKHLPIYFIGAIKYWWDPTKGIDGDYVIDFVHPDNLLLDYVPSTNADDMGIVVEKSRMTLKEALNRFPKKKAELLRAVLGNDESKIEKEEQRGYATEITVEEVWFKWYTDAKEEKGERCEEYVLWRYKGSTIVILDKKKNPNYDYEGTTAFMTTDEQGQERQLSQEELMQMAMGMGDMSGVKTKKVYRNYFTHPRKPYIFINYDWLGNSPLDDTSRIEQVQLLQDNVEIRGRQITDIANTSRGKLIGSTEGGLDKGDLEKMDMTNPNQNFFVKGELSKAIMFLPGEQPSGALFQDQDINRNRVFAKMGVNATTRGSVETDTATTAQIARESDFGMIDDLVEDTINYAFEEIAMASMHMIKLRYTKEHMRQILGKDGQTVFKKITSDMIEDGMTVSVSASATDKIMRKREAYELAGMQLIDPVTFYEDIDASDPSERARRLMIYLSNPAQYQMEIVEGKSPEEMAAMVGGPQAAMGGAPAAPVDPMAQGAPQAGMEPQQGMMPEQAPQDTGNQEALMAIAQIQEGQMPPAPAQTSPGFVDTINQYLQSSDFTSLPPQLQELAIQFAQSLSQGAAPQPAADPMAGMVQSM